MLWLWFVLFCFFFPVSMKGALTFSTVFQHLDFFFTVTVPGILIARVDCNTSLFLIQTMRNGIKVPSSRFWFRFRSLRFRMLGCELACWVALHSLGRNLWQIARLERRRGGEIFCFWFLCFLLGWSSSFVQNSKYVRARLSQLVPETSFWDENIVWSSVPDS